MDTRTTTLNHQAIDSQIINGVGVIVQFSTIPLMGTKTIALSAS